MGSSLIEEVWTDLEQDYPGYSISNHGRIVFVKSGVMKHPATNAGGILMVNFSHKGEQTVRSVALLVANLYLPKHERSHFDTPICLDGNRSNCHVENLMWRPRWFAILYHQQFSKPNWVMFKQTNKVEDLNDGRVFDSVADVATTLGMRAEEVLLAITNNNYVFPTNARFKFYEP